MRKIKKITALFLAVLMSITVFALPSQAVNIPETTLEPITEPISPQSITIASCVFRNFYYDSSSSTVTLSQGCDFVSFQVTCESGSDTIIAEITDLSNGGAYNSTLVFEADGNATTFETYFGAGSYTVELYGTNKLHRLGLVAFST